MADAVARRARPKTGDEEEPTRAEKSNAGDDRPAWLVYCDPISTAPASAWASLVSCIGASRYDAEIVRPLDPQAGPFASAFRIERVASPVNRSYSGRRQAIPHRLPSASA